MKIVTVCAHVTSLRNSHGKVLHEQGIVRAFNTGISRENNEAAVDSAWSVVFAEQRFS